MGLYIFQCKPTIFFRAVQALLHFFEKAAHRLYLHELRVFRRHKEREAIIIQGLLDENIDSVSKGKPLAGIHSLYTALDFRIDSHLKSSCFRGIYDIKGRIHVHQLLVNIIPNRRKSVNT